MRTRRGGVGVEAAEARAVGGEEGGDGSGAGDRAPVDVGDPEFDGAVVDEVAGLEVVGAVDEDAREVPGVLDEVFGVGGGEVGDVGVDGDVGVGGVEPRFGGDRLGDAIDRVLVGEEGLAVEVGAFDEVAVDDGELPDAGTGEEVGADAAERSDADDEGVGRGELGLSFGSDGAGAGLAGVAFVVGVGAHGEV